MKTLKIASWNVNSINARIHILKQWLLVNQPDIVLLQEIKCQEQQFPFQEIEDLGYNIALNAQKTYNGVAILSKYILSDIRKNFTNNPDANQARYIEALITYQHHQVIKVSSVYVPNGTDIDHENFQYKLAFLEAFYQYNKNLLDYDEKMVIGGDFNVANQAIDVFDESSCYNNLCCHIEERKIFRKILNSGFYDSFRAINHLAKKFSWWDYRAGAWQKNLGLRIDYLLSSPAICNKINNCYIDDATRNLEKPSDHAPVILSLC